MVALGQPICQRTTGGGGGRGATLLGICGGRGGTSPELGPLIPKPQSGSLLRLRRMLSRWTSRAPVEKAKILLLRNLGCALQEGRNIFRPRYLKQTDRHEPLVLGDPEL